MTLLFNHRIFLYIFIGSCMVTTGYGDTSCDSCNDGATASQLAAIEFILFPNNSLDYSIKVLASDATKLNDYIDYDKPTVLYVHGWTEYPTSESVLVVLGAYCEREDHNVILANYEKIAALDYWNASSSVEAVGYTMATGLNAMVNAGLDSSTLYVVGHSLGGQVAGAIGRNLEFVLRKIFGLDPAGPHFITGVDSHCLSSTDAEQVVVIHTDAGGFGVNSSDGSVNFWPNGGTFIQPGCDYDNAILGNNCCHLRSWQFYAESLLSEEAFIGVRCESWDIFQTGACSSNPTAVMGYATPPDTTGDYYLQTSDSSPFGLGDTGTTYVE